MSLRLELLELESRVDSILMVIISIIFSLLSVGLFILVLGLFGFEIDVSNLLEYAVFNIFKNTTDIALMLYWMTPLILTGLAVGIAFRAGLFNIGGQGQMVIGGAASAIWAASIAPGLDNSLFNYWIIMIPTTILIGFVFGAIWGFIPGWLKAKTGAHEVIVTIMMNLIAISVVTYLTGSRTFSPFIDTTSVDAYGQTEQIMDSARVPLMFPDTSSFLNYTLIYALVIVVILQILLFRTNFGFKIRAVGLNKTAADAAGINSDRITIIAMTLSGGVAGLAGAFYVMGTFPYRFIIGAEGTLGFDGIAVALIGQNSPIGIAFAALLFGFLAQSKNSLDINTEIPPDIIFAFQGLVILFAAAPFLSRLTISLIKDIKNLLADMLRYLKQSVKKYFKKIDRQEEDTDV